MNISEFSASYRVTLINQTRVSRLNITVPYQDLLRLHVTCGDNPTKSFGVLKVAGKYTFRQCSLAIYISAFISGVFSAPENFTVSPDYYTVTDPAVLVHFSWSPPPELTAPNDARVDTHYTITIMTSSVETNMLIMTTNTIFTAFTTSLTFNESYMVTVYASICGNTLRGNPYQTNFTIPDGNCTCSMYSISFV